MVMAINYVAVLIGAVAAFLLGMLWYSPLLFGKTWASGHKLNEEQIKEMGSPNSAHLVGFLSFIVTGAVLDMVLQSLGVITAPMALRVAFLLWLGLCGAPSLMHAMYQRKPLHLYLIDVGYTLGYVAIIAVILTLWRS